MIVRVEDVFLITRMSGDVNLRDTFGRYRVHIIHGVELVVHRRNVNVVHVEQYAAIGALDHVV